MDNMSKFSERLIELMSDNNIKSEKLAEKLGIQGSTIRRWIRNENSIFLSQLVQLAHFFKCPIDYLVGRIDFFNEFSPKDCPPFIPRLYQLLENHGVSTYKLNKETSIKYSYFTRWKRTAEPHLCSLIELANYFECSIDYLVGLES